jgi:hypothetical protein
MYDVIKIHSEPFKMFKYNRILLNLFRIMNRKGINRYVFTSYTQVNGQRLPGQIPGQVLPGQIPGQQPFLGQNFQGQMIPGQALPGQVGFNNVNNLAQNQQFLQQNVGNPNSCHVR